MCDDDRLAGVVAWLAGTTDSPSEPAPYPFPHPHNHSNHNHHNHNNHHHHSHNNHHNNHTHNHTHTNNHTHPHNHPHHPRQPSNTIWLTPPTRAARRVLFETFFDSLCSLPARLYAARRQVMAARLQSLTAAPAAAAAAAVASAATAAVVASTTTASASATASATATATAAAAATSSASAGASTSPTRPPRSRELAALLENSPLPYPTHPTHRARPAPLDRPPPAPIAPAAREAPIPPVVTDERDKQCQRELRTFLRVALIGTCSRTDKSLVVPLLPLYEHTVSLSSLSLPLLV
jgi:hypothetical protein